VLDVVVDLRVGSPTFGVVDSVVLDEVDRRALFIAEGLGHAFCALSDDASLTYLVSSVYNPAIERGVSPLDTDLDLPWPMAAADLELSDKDRDAPTLAAAIAADELPTYEACRAAYASQS
jgi:dTDP-4-dehydrorhamnose 3,5-epimerase